MSLTGFKDSRQNETHKNRQQNAFDDRHFDSASKKRIDIGNDDDENKINEEEEHKNCVQNSFLALGTVRDRSRIDRLCIETQNENVL